MTQFLDIADKLSQEEKDTRDRFAREYLEDYNEVSALIRVGYAPAYARMYAARFMTEAYTLNKIKELEIARSGADEKEMHRARIISKLYKIVETSSSPAASVSALAQLSKIVGIEAPVKVETKFEDVSPDLSHLTVEEMETMRALITKPKNDAAPTTH